MTPTLLGVLLHLVVGAPADSLPPTAAVVRFEARGLSDEDAQTLADRFRSELSGLGGFRLMERAKLDEVLREQGLQESGCTSTECVVQTGRLLGVRRMVAGSVAHLGSTWTVSAREIDVESGEIRRVAVVDFQQPIDVLLTKGMRQLAEKLVGKEISEAMVVPEPIPSEPAPVEPVTPDTSHSLLEPTPSPAGTVPLQVVVATVALPPAKSVSGFSINLGWGRIDQLRGIQVGIVNQVDSIQYGIEGGLLNFVGDQRGIQAGLVNSARSTRGIQAGLLNIGGPLNGIQAGLVNIAGETNSPQFGLVNVWTRDGVTRIMPVVGGLF